MTATDLAVRDPQPAAIPAKLQYARALAESGLLPSSYRKNPANVLWAAEYGDMLGIGTMAAITGVHVIEGKPTASAGLISALVRRAGHKLRVHGDGDAATCQIVRSDDPGYTFEVTFTAKDAQAAGLLSKDVWKKYRPSMLKARAITQCARDACEEALFGLHYTAEELGAEVDEDGVIVEESPAAQPRGRGTVFIDPECLVENEQSRLAERSGGTPDDDQWYVHPEPAPGGSQRWAETAIAQAAALKSEHAGSKLWAEAVEKVNVGELSRDDYDKIKELIGAQIEYLRQQAFDKAMSALSENESWRAKIEELTSGDDADTALRELDEMADKQRAGRIRHAITTLAILRRWNTTDTDREAA